MRTKPLVRLAIRRLLPALGALVAPTLAGAATWDGGGADDNWNTGLNWGGTAPVAGDPLFFGGSVRLAPVNNIAAYTAFSGITFSAGAGAFTLSGNRITLGGDVAHNASSLQTLNLDLIVGATRTVAASGGNVVLGGVISGAGGLTKTGVNSLVLSGANSFGGVLSVTDGTLSVPVWNNAGANGPLGNSATSVTLGGASTAGTLRYTGGGSNFAPSTIKALSLAAGGGRVEMVYSAGDRNLNYVHINGDRLTGSGGLTVDTFAGGATSRFIVIGSASYIGPTVVAANGELQTNYLTVGVDGTPFGAGSNGLGSAVTVNAGGLLTFYSAGASTTVALGSLSGSGTVQGESTGTHTFKVGGDNTSTTFSGVIQNNGGPVAVTKVGTGTQALTGSNSFSGPVAVENGTLSVSAWNNDSTNGPLGNSATPVTLGGSSTMGTLRYTGGGSNNAPTTIKPISLAAGGGRVEMVYSAGNRGANYIHINGDRITGGGGLTVNTFAGGATSRFIVVGSAPYTGPTVVAANSELQTNYDVAGDGTPFGAGSNGLGSAVTVNGGGLLTFFSFGNSRTVALGSLSGSGTVQGEGGGTHAFKIGGDNSSTVFSGAFQNNGGPVEVTKVGSGTLTLSGSSSHTGLVSVNGGAITVPSWNQSGSAGPWGAAVNNAGAPAATFIQMNGGRINYTGADAGGALRGVNLVSGVNTIDVIPGATLNFAGGFNTFQSNGGNLVKEGGGVLQIGTFSVANNIFNGKVTINNGALDWFGAGSMPTPGALVPDFITINTGAKFQLTYPDVPTTLSANIGFKVAGSAGILTAGSHTIPGVIADGATAGSLVKTGTGTLVLGGANTYTGKTSIQQGTVQLTGTSGTLGLGNPSAAADALTLGSSGNAGTLRVSGGNLNLGAGRGLALAGPGGSLDVDASRTFFLSGDIDGNVGGLTLTKAGAGTFNLTGNASINALVVSGGAYRQSAGTTSILTTSTGLSVSGGAEYELAGGTLRTDRIQSATGNFKWGAGTLTHLQTSASGNNTGAFSSPGFQEVRSGVTLRLEGSTATSSGAVLSLHNSPTIYLSADVRFNNLYVTGLLDLTAAGDSLGVEINPYLLRPFSPVLGASSLESGSLPLVVVNDATGELSGQFDAFGTVLNDGLGFTQHTGSFTSAAALPVNTWYLEYAQNVGDPTGSIAGQGVGTFDIVFFHYKVSGYVPEPDTFGLLALGLIALRRYRRRQG